MFKYHPDKVGDKYIEKCKEITVAYSKIMKSEFQEDAIIPKEFRDMGFDKVPTLHEYVTKKFYSLNACSLVDIIFHDNK